MALPLCPPNPCRPPTLPPRPAPLRSGIFAIFNSSESKEGLRELLIQCSNKIRHRGPDWSGYHFEEGKGGKHGIAHERLAIMDPESGAQPLKSEDESIVVAVNGEVYNFK